MPIYKQNIGFKLYGSGSDGNATFDASATVLGLAPASGVYTLTRDVYCVNLSLTTTAQINCNGFRIFADILSVDSGCVILAGANNASGITGGTSLSGRGVYFTTCGAGANGRSTLGAGTVGSGSGGGNVTGSTSGAGGQADGGNLGGAGNSSAALGANSGGLQHWSPWFYGRAPGSSAGNTIAAMSAGGGGGSGGCQPATGTATSGGGGSGSLILGIFCNVFNNSGTIKADGGNGGNASATGDGKAGGGGGGAAGAVAIFYNRLINTGTITANGGTGGSGVGGGTSGSNGTSGLIIFEKLSM